MRKTVLFAAAGVGLLIALASHDAQAFAPMGAMPVAPSDATTVAGTAGRGADAAEIRSTLTTEAAPGPARRRYPSLRLGYVSLY